jgi:hypothetical protein
MKAVSGNKFSTKYVFYGIVPFLNHTISLSSVKTTDNKYFGGR